MWKFYWSELDPIKWPHSKSWFGQFEFEPGLGVRSTWAPPPSSAWPSSRAAGWPGRRAARQPLHPPAKMLEMLKTWNLSWTHVVPWRVFSRWVGHDKMVTNINFKKDLPRWLPISTSSKTYQDGYKFQLQAKLTKNLPISTLGKLTGIVTNFNFKQNLPGLLSTRGILDTGTVSLEQR